MDNVTHSLVGLFLSRAGFNRVTPYATGILILAASAPDVDICSAFGGTLNYFHFHRHFTHSFLFAPVLALAATALIRLAFGPFPWQPAFWTALAGVLSHLLLDLTNSYGVRVLLPFSGRWLRGDLLSVIDIWIWIISAVCIFAPLLSRLVGSEIGAPKKQKYPGRGFAIAALAFVALYTGGRWILHERALAILDSRQYDGATALRVAAFPVMSNPLRWRGVAETSASYRVFDLDLLRTFDPTQGVAAFKGEPSPAIDAANATEPFRIFRDFAEFPLWTSVPAAEPEGAVHVELTDMRFGFVCSSLIDRQNRVISSEFHFGEVKIR